MVRSTLPIEDNYLKKKHVHMFRPLLEAATSKKWTPLWHEAHFEANMFKHHMFGPHLEVAMLKKCTLLWCEAQFEVKSVKH